PRFEGFQPANIPFLIELDFGLWSLNFELCTLYFEFRTCLTGKLRRRTKYKVQSSKFKNQSPAFFQVITLFSNTINRNRRKITTATSTKRRLGSYPASSMTTLEISRTFCTRCLTSPSTPRASVVARCSFAPTVPRGRGFGADCGAAAGLSIARVSDIDLGGGSIAIVSDIEAGGGPVSGASSGAV